MNIYLIEQDELSGYDTYSGAIVVAKDEADARLISPTGYKDEIDEETDEWGGWVGKDYVIGGSWSGKGR